MLLIAQITDAFAADHIHIFRQPLRNFQKSILLRQAKNYETTISYFQKFVNPQFLGIDFFRKSCNTIRQKAKALWITLSKVPFHIL